MLSNLELVSQHYVSARGSAPLLTQMERLHPLKRSTGSALTINAAKSNFSCSNPL